MKNSDGIRPLRKLITLINIRPRVNHYQIFGRSSNASPPSRRSPYPFLIQIIKKKKRRGTPKTKRQLCPWNAKKFELLMSYEYRRYTIIFILILISYPNYLYARDWLKLEARVPLRCWRYIRRRRLSATFTRFCSIYFTSNTNQILQIFLQFASEFFRLALKEWHERFLQIKKDDTFEAMPLRFSL